MPVMDGFQATEKIRELHSSKSQTPIIAVTANAMESDRMRCFDAGMDAYLSKPVDLVNLRRVVEEVVLEGKKQQPQARPEGVTKLRSTWRKDKRTTT